jgi:hypothetical protein
MTAKLCGPEDTAMGTALFFVLGIVPLSIGGPWAIGAGLTALGMFIHDRTKAGTKPIRGPVPKLPAMCSTQSPKLMTGTIRSTAKNRSKPTAVYSAGPPKAANPSVFKTLPIGTLLDCPYVVIVGGSRSGKTTLATAISILRKQRGDVINYATTDTDLPPCVDWNNKAIGLEAYGQMIDDLTASMDGADVGQLRGHAYQFDELLAAASLGIPLTPFITSLLTRGPKSGATVTLITHTDTVSSHGLGPGLSEALIRDRVLIEAIRDRLPTGGYAPSGRYRVTFPGEAPTVWEWPQWAMDVPGGPLAALQSQSARRSS